jgi:hypothetical protein
MYINVHVLDKTESYKSIYQMKKKNIMFYYSDVNCANYMLIWNWYTYLCGVIWK